MVYRRRDHRVNSPDGSPEDPWSENGPGRGCCVEVGERRQGDVPPEILKKLEAAYALLKITSAWRFLSQIDRLI